MKINSPKSSFFFGLVLIMLFFNQSCKSDNSIKLIRLGHGLDISHSVHQAMVKADLHLKEISNGKMRLQIYPNQQLGSCLLYTSPSPRDGLLSRMPSSA